ncbi:hypothetical protein PF005_g14387 [Phytophthora fragariae]|uniref:Uncharacterized protein n=2 Tax=Phytophthora fragariae TaxID=53985 RepID=A0A6A3XJ13_9STRA|nr:hypothetical protein PF011_g13579 [Phytophthora fragariae]KAE9101840.1 hypothetical protein PF010_g14317 [Phytophthora fragariae]KAE9139249.1 hypothetical protein PF006_g13791 [Phytophthora fragariae]KAE9202939.1 hypothetical protein PF005_g14387 [Phytophthora fragariae]KAE9220069.1 hypothetical protein PF002_g15998 [Phytophthora fragariae]
MMLQLTSSLVRHTIEREEAQCLFNRHVMTEVQNVLDEMVYDVESCEHECEITRLRQQLATADSSLQEFQERESELIQERQQAYEYAVKVEQEGRTIMGKLNEHLSVVVAELAKKELMEKELHQAKEQLKLTGQLSKELASAQREIRELRRANDIQYILRKNNSVPAKLVSDTRPPPRIGHAPVRAMSVPEGLTTEMKQEENVFSQLPDKIMLKLFSFLDEDSMIAMSVTDRVLVRRVNEMFGVTTPSTLANSAAPKQHPPPPTTRKQSKTRGLSFIGSSEKDKLSKVDAIVKSLKPDQIKLFHDMSTRVKTLEAHLAQVQAEKEDVAARLYSAENVRDFLMEKLKDLEDTLANTMTTTAKKDEQAGLDREIIGFLDAKTQEYETALQEYAHQNNGLRMEIAQLHEEQASKTRIIQDIVELLTEEKKELELQIRSQRKILVREVKALRSQNQQLFTEKDHYFTQLKQLKHALQHLDELS